MTRYGQIGWRMAAVAAFFGTAALAIALSRAPADNGIGRQLADEGVLELWRAYHAGEAHLVVVSAHANLSQLRRRRPRR